jgi:5-hydroxyisourate hydrolase-like protein (transthyretin family)
LRLRLLAVTAVAALLCSGAIDAHAQAVSGRVLDDATGIGIAGVEVQLLNQAGTRVGQAVTDSAGAFHIPGRGPGKYSLALSHLGYRAYRTDPFDVPYLEIVEVNVRLARDAIPLDAITVTGRRRTPEYHEPTYAGLYARMEQLPRVGTNRIIMKNDQEMRSVTLVGELLRQYFFGVTRNCTPTVFWHGFAISNPEIARMRIERTHVDDLEAIEVYRDFLMAPAQFRDPVGLLTTTPCAVVALWPRRPDLPGRGK